MRELVRKRFNVRAHLPLVRESERVLARTKKGLKKNQNEVVRTKKGLKSAWRDFKATWYTGLKLILFINTPGTFCAREQKGL